MVARKEETSIAQWQHTCLHAVAESRVRIPAPCKYCKTASAAVAVPVLYRRSSEKIEKTKDHKKIYTYNTVQFANLESENFKETFQKGKSENRICFSFF